MRKLFYLVLMFGFMCGTFSMISCGDGDGKKNPENTNGGEDFGADGVKGYWIKDSWETLLFDGYADASWGKFSVKGDVSMMLYLDGEGGGVMYRFVTTLDKLIVKNDTGYVKDKKQYTSGYVGRFQDTVDGSENDFYHPCLFASNFSTTEIKSLNQTYPLTYYIQGSTMTIYFNNNTETLMLSVVSGQVSQYHRMKKVG